MSKKTHSWDERAIAEILRGARRRLHRGWTSGHQARSRIGDPVPPEHPDAASWCTFGAIRAECLARYPDRPCDAHLLAEAVAKHLGTELRKRGGPICKRSAPRTLMEWNDLPSCNQDTVLAVYDQTLAALTQQPERRARVSPPAGPPGLDQDF